MEERQFLQLIDQHQGIIHKICGIYRDSREDREDLFQEIVFQLWKSAPGFKGESKFTSWMYRIALSTAVVSFRKKKPAIIYTQNLPEQESITENEQAALHQEQLFEAVKKLNDADKALITLYLEDLSYEEMAEITGISENYVGVRLNRIKTKIENLLKNKK